MAPKARQLPAATSPGRSFSIASFFDAASAGRRGAQRLSGHGYRIEDPSASQEVSTSQRLSSSSHTAFSDADGGNGAYHWSSRLPNVDGLPGSSLADAPVEGGYSNTMQAVRQRILDDLSAADGSEKSRRNTGVSGASASPAAKLQQHRKRALNIAFGGEDDLMVSAVEFALTCPYSRLPLRIPVRSRHCNHLQCCDLDSWMVMMDKHKSLRDPKAPCPVCEQRVSASTLEVDVWMLHVLQQMPVGTHLVVLDADGSYHSGDTTREKRREEITMEVIDATQGDFENFLGDIVEDDEDEDAVVTMSAPSARPHIGTKRTRDQTGHDPRPPGITSNDPHASPTVIVKREPNALDDSAPHKDESSPHQDTPPSPSAQASSPLALSQVPSPTQDDGVVIVHFIEPTAHGRALPSRIRDWVFYCPACQTAQLKGEAGLEGTQGTQGTSSSSPTPALPSPSETCSHCGNTTRDQWSLVRRFSGVQQVTMELVADGTVLLRGVDAASPYLSRAGFTRTRFSPQEFQTPLPQGFRPEVGVWVTTGLLSRFEIDFLEACCERLAAGETALESLDGMMVPALFRIPRRRRAGANGLGFSVSQRF